ncbi:uncharacterized protein LOC122382919 isoform X1 [Amphibalanus amphitrite]|uniref:uncharacterized protein LOC122382919 isoform X1 n=2 Tax=Amphibalanus amphitrite TaxID=1232801 RepID=UPI001C926014|nr:uncharacterized protein LOC122382919 isoform X1 [Amphibalanus amphitrite]
MPESLFSEICLDEVGFLGSQCSVEECRSADDTGDSSCMTLDRVSITVPYSNASFGLRLLLSADNQELAPDFIFDDPTFLSSCDAADLEKLVPALRDWRRLSDLPALLRQLLTAYKSHVVSRLTPGGALWDGYSQLLAELGPDALEPMVAAGEARPALYVLVRLPLDLSTLWERPPPGRRPCALLLLKATENGGVKARLRLSPALAALATDCRLPPPASRPLTEYVQLVTELTQRQLQEGSDVGRARRLLVAALVTAAPDRLLDLSADCSRISLRWDGAVAELLLAAYPRRPATLCLASTAGRWRREVPLTLSNSAPVPEVVDMILDKVEELLKGVDRDSDSDESLL